MSCHQRDREVVLTVADDGIGFTQEEQGRIFRPFCQVGPRAGRTLPGTGLLLTVAERLVIALGGRIKLESEPDRGTWVTVTLPGAATFGRSAAAPVMRELVHADSRHARARPDRRRRPPRPGDDAGLHRSPRLRGARRGMRGGRAQRDCQGGAGPGAARRPDAADHRDRPVPAAQERSGDAPDPRGPADRGARAGRAGGGALGGRGRLLHEARPPARAGRAPPVAHPAEARPRGAGGSREPDHESRAHDRGARSVHGGPLRAAGGHGDGLRRASRVERGGAEGAAAGRLPARPRQDRGARRRAAEGRPAQRGGAAS